MNALELAEKLDREWHNDALNYDTAQNAAAELRRLHAINAELLNALQILSDVASRCDSWQSFPDEPLQVAYEAVEKAKQQEKTFAQKAGEYLKSKDWP